MRFRSLFCLACLFVLPACDRSGNYPPLETAASVDVARYMGTWYEIARLPNSFEKDCYAVQVQYTLNPDGSVTVLNRCNKGSVTGKLDEAEGKATVVDKTTNAKLKVQFFFPFKGDYWILERGENYEYAVIGEPKREYFWILSRQPTLDAQLLAGIKERAQKQGFDLSPLIYTEHGTQ